MSFLKILTVQNIQSHRKTEIEFSPGVNAIVGATNAGKSVLIRSIKKVAQNRPSGEAFRSHWGGRSLIELEFADGEVVGWMKEDKATYYHGDQDYFAFKTDVPQEIQDALNLSKINLQEQMDLPFLLADSSSEVGKVLNKAANLVQIDESVSGIRKRLLNNGAEIKETEERLKELEDQRDSFQFLDQMERDVARYEKLTDDQSGLSGDIAVLSKLIVIIKELSGEVDQLDAFLRAEQDLSLALSLVEENKRLSGEIRLANKLIGDIRANQKEVKELEEFLQAESKMESGLQLLEEERIVYGQWAALHKLIQDIKKQNAFIEEEDHNLKIMERSFKDKFPEHCPFCGRRGLL